MAVFLSYGLRGMTAENYARQLLSFCELVSDVSQQFILTRAQLVRAHEYEKDLTPIYFPIIINV